MLKKILIIAAIVIIIALSFVAYLFLKTPEEVSVPLEAVPVVVEQDLTETNEAETTELVLQSQTEEPIINSESNTVPETAPTETVETEETVTEPEESAEVAAPKATSEEPIITSAPTIFEIVPAQAEARFVLGEVLKGSPFTVVGTTDQVAAEFAVDAADLATTHIGPVLVNARTLATDSSFRDRAIKNRILSTDEYEFITFTPTNITSLSGPGAVGESYNFQIAGDLTIRDVTRPVTFEATATALSESQIQATATTTILWADYNLTIPQVPQVAGVDEAVMLEIEFVATPKNETG